MHHLLVDTCVWLELAKDWPTDEQPVEHSTGVAACDVMMATG
jgi:hypothetical protein